MRCDRKTSTTAATLALRVLFALVVLLGLLAGIVGGLVRAGVFVPRGGSWLTQAVLGHAFLMICAFMGAVIGIERAVAVKKLWAYASPVAAGMSGLAALAELPMAARTLGALAAAVFVAVNILVLKRQWASHTVLLLVAALAWLAGSLLFALQVVPAAVIPWWFSFLVLTIAAERLEMTRLMRRRAAAAPALYVTLGAMLLGSALSGLSAVWGGLVYGLALVALAIWLLTFDLARCTVKTSGLSRYMAICLITGYAWLAVSGVAWVAASFGQPLRDMALHALGLGFVFSMMLGHAPVILPAVARTKVLFGRAFYLPLFVLHASLVARLFGSSVDLHLLPTAAAANVLAIGLFAATMVGSVIAWRRKYSSPTSTRDHDAAVEH